MSKVDWITWKTNPSEIINPQEIVDKIDKLYENYNTYMNPIVYENLKMEILNGGLSQDSFSINGRSPSNEIAIDILKRIENIKKMSEYLRNSIMNFSLEQKNIEKQQLLKAIHEKIQNEKAIIQRIQSNQYIQDDISYVNTNNQDMIEITTDRIQKLEQKMEYVQSL